MAGWLECDDGPVRNCDEKCQENCGVRDGSVCQKSVVHENGMPTALFDQAVLVLLRKLYAKNAIKSISVSLTYNQSVDLYKLFCLVREKGGVEAVSRGNLWGLVANNMDLDVRNIASLKFVYYNKLADLDQWLDSMRKEWNLGEMSDEWGRNLELFSLELEKRISVLFRDDAKLVNKKRGDIPAGGHKIYANEKVARKENLQVPVDKENKESLGNGNIANSTVDERTGENEVDISAERPDLDSVESESRCKRKRESSEEVFVWLKKIAKNPFQLSKMEMLNSSKWRGNGVKEYLPLALSMRVGMLKKKCCNSDGIFCCLHQKQEIQPSTYDDPATCRLPGIRFSKRVPALVKSPMFSNCVSLETKQRILENGAEVEEDRTHDLPRSSSSKKTDGSSTDKQPAKYCIEVGREFQAEIPPLTGESDSKWLGTCTWAPQKFTPVGSLGRGRLDTCDCKEPGTVDCVRFHIMDNNLRLKLELGKVYYQWNLHRTGEMVSLPWTPEEEDYFKNFCDPEMSATHSSFPNKTRQELVDYYFNVYLNRGNPTVDSVKWVPDFGAVRPGICTQK